MKVSEIMTADAAACGPHEMLTCAASIMWQRDCGVVPVVDGDRHVLGVITDRDICMALVSRDALATEIRIKDVMSADVVTCRTDDRLEDVLDKMGENQVHRLPVIDADGVMVGMVSLSDLFRLATKQTKKKGRLARKDVLRALLKISSAEAGTDRNNAVEAETAIDVDLKAAGTG
ncbi:MAG: CBS domain-containing protein [Pyrinomonadaceae bacterium]